METPDWAAARADYLHGHLADEAIPASPVELFATWLAEAQAAESNEPNAMVLATATPDGRPSARVVLAKQVDADGVVFFTNGGSRKGHELAENPQAALVFVWPVLQRQVRVEGAVAMLPAADDDAYFASRPRGAQLGAIASRQSAPIADRMALERQFAEAAAAAGEGPVVRPDAWGGYRVAWDVVEFWQGRENRLHDRIRFTRSDDGWTRERLQP
jgi:pyridoxamine 5'-phosphate oxidase